MYKIKTFNKIAKIGLDRLSPEEFTISEDHNDPSAIILRSHKLHDMGFNNELLAIGRAGAGVNNVPVDKCTEQAIVVFNAPGANANAVKELVLMGLLLSSRDVLGGIDYTKTLTGSDDDISKAVEKSKSLYGGSELQGKTLGVIGLGAIGSMVANTAINFGMKVLGFDPYISIDWAWSLNRQVVRADNLVKMLKEVDFLSLNVPCTESTRSFFNSDKISHIKPGAIVVNFARPEIVVESDIVDGLNNGRLRKYITDFPSSLTINHPNVIAVPHLGASTKEAEDNCAIMIANQIQSFLKTGNIKNSVNFPTCHLEPSGVNRLAITNKNIPNILGQVTGLLAQKEYNIAEMLNKSRGDIAYTLIDTDRKLSEDLLNQISDIDGVIRVRLIDLTSI